MNEKELEELNLDHIMEEFSTPELSAQKQEDLPREQEPSAEDNFAVAPEGEDERNPEELSEPEVELTEIPEEPEKDPQVQPVTEDTVRLDSVALAQALEDVGAAKTEGAEVSSDTIRLDDISQALNRNMPNLGENSGGELDLEEVTPAPIVFRPKSRLRELKRKLIAGPEKRYYELAELGVGKIQFAMLFCFLIIALSVGIGWMYNSELIPENRQRLMVFSQILIMLVAALLGSQQMLDGIWDLFSGKFSLNTMLTLTFFACCADSVFCLQELRVPICSAFAVEVFMALWAAYHRRTAEMGQMDTMRKAVRLDSVVRCEDYQDGKPGFLRGEGQVEDFMDHYTQTPGPEKTQNIYALIAFLLSIAIAVAAGLLHSLSMGVQILSTSLLVAVPASFFISITRPMAVVERKLHRIGTVLCGWRGIKGFRGKGSYPLDDDDLFPAGSSKLNGVKFYGQREPETVIAYAAALMKSNGGGLAPVFSQLLESRNGIEYEAENLQFYGNGGIGGEILGEPVLMGTLDFLKEMGVEIPEEVMVRQAVYVAIDGELSGLFAVSYTRTKYTAKGLGILCNYRKLRVLILADDFMVTAPFLKEKFGVRTRRVAFPDRQMRTQLREKKPGEDTPVLALMTQEGLAPAASAITGARAMRRAWGIGVAIHMAGGIVGLLIMAALAVVGDVALLTPLHILAYQLIWVVPGFLATLWAHIS